ncbi:MAG: hypothetical protein U0457_18680 [Candidatus Sericytochromatia bacterium]
MKKKFLLFLFFVLNSCDVKETAIINQNLKNKVSFEYISGSAKFERIISIPKELESKVHEIYAKIEILKPIKPREMIFFTENIFLYDKKSILEPIENMVKLERDKDYKIDYFNHKIEILNFEKYKQNYIMIKYFYIGNNFEPY